MMPWVVILIGLLLVAWGIWGEFGGRDGIAGIIGVCGIVVTLCAAAMLLVMVVNRTTVGNDLVQIAQVREAAAVVDLGASEDIYGKVVDVNQLIASNRWYRQRWWARDFVPAAWDTVSLIPVRN